MMLGWAFELQGFGEERWSVDVGVAVNLAVAEERGVFKAGDELEDAVLFAELQVILEAYQVVTVSAEVSPGGVGRRHKASGRSLDR